MLDITCPSCGRRPLDEYRFGGEVPTIPDSVVDPDARDVDNAWFLDNPAGATTERWFHAGGCRRWLTLGRDTTTDRLPVRSEPLGDLVPPAVAPES